MKKLPSEYSFLTPFRSKHLKRLGINKDGGYVIDGNLLKKSNFLISFGMANEYSFEEDFLKINKKNSLTIYDFSISNIYYILEICKIIRRIIKFKKTIKDLSSCIIDYYKFLNFINKKKVSFFSKKICHVVKNSKETTLKEVFKKFNKKNLILKVDIECSEYEIIEDIIIYYKNINQIIIEFHDTHIRKKDFFNKIKIIQKYFFITHLHANNFRNYNQDGFPINIEITFINRKFFNNSYKKNFIYPINKIDYPNNIKLKDLIIKFAKN